MGAASRSDLRARVAAVLAVNAAWRESRVPYERFGSQPQSLADHAFAVGILGSTPVGDRQRATDGILVFSDVRVRFALEVTPKEPMASYDAGLDAGDDLMRAILEDGLGDARPDFVSTTGGVNTTGEWFVGDVRFSILHQLGL